MNIEKIRQKLPEYKCDAIMLTDRINRYFATGFPSSAGTLLISRNGAQFITDSRYFEAAKHCIKDAETLSVTSKITYADLIKTFLEKHRVNNLGFEDEALSYAVYRDRRAKLKVKMIPAQKLVSELRMYKSSFDLGNIKTAQQIAEKSFNEILPLIGFDITEKQLAAELTIRMLKNGADDKAFDPVVVSGTKTSLPHGVPEDIRLSEGFLTLDFGARYNAWNSDTTRTLCIGNPNEQMMYVYDTVLKAQETAIVSVRGGVLGQDLDTMARAVIDDAGYGDYFDHGLGHGVGLEVHELPRVSQNYRDVIPSGSVITVEPGIYIPGCFGVRIEDLLYVTENGYENLSTLTKKMIII